MVSSVDLPERQPNEAIGNLMPPGSYIVPHFNELGQKLEEGEVFGHPSVVDKVISLMNKHAKGSGAEVVKIKEKGKKRKAKVKNVSNPTTFAPVYKPEPTTLTQTTEDVVFNTEFGQIVLGAEAVLDSSTALGLVFKSDKDMRFVPKIGTYCQVKTRSFEGSCYFPGIILTWTDGEKTIMILVKGNETTS